MTMVDTTAPATANHSALHPRIAELFAELDASRAALLATLEAMPEAARHAPANGEEWTVPQILEHLAIVENGAGMLVAKIVSDVESSGTRETESASVIPMNAAFRIATSDVRITAPERTRPSGGLTIEESLERMESGRAKLKAVLTRASGLALGSATFPHPVWGPINGYQWALATAQHERRHIAQLRRVAGMSA